MPPSVTLYELAAVDGTRFSPYCWRTRWALKHKGVAFRSLSVHFDQLEKLGGAQKAVPAISIDGKFSEGSWTIAETLDQSYPDRPPLFACPSAKGTTRFVESFVDKVVNPSLLRLFARDAFDRMDERDQAYFRSSREKALGCTLEQAQSTRDDFVRSFRNMIHPIRLTLGKQPWLGGQTPEYADYVALGSFQWARLTTDFAILLENDPVHEWFVRGLALFDEFGNQVGPNDGDGAYVPGASGP